MNRNGNAGLWIVLGVVGLVLVFGIGIGARYVLMPKQPQQQVSAPPAQDETANWKVYRNEKYGFEFKYPQEYLLNEIPGLIGFRQKMGLGLGTNLKLLIKDKQGLVAPRFEYPPTYNDSINTWVVPGRTLTDCPLFYNGIPYFVDGVYDSKKYIIITNKDYAVYIDHNLSEEAANSETISQHVTEVILNKILNTLKFIGDVQPIPFTCEVVDYPI